jgi:hypothetical protein
MGTVPERDSNELKNKHFFPAHFLGCTEQRLK